MGFLDKFRKKNSPDDDLDQLVAQQQAAADVAGEAPSDSEDDTAPGWDAITAHFETAYPDQTSPAHYGTLVKYWMGGNDPIDGISAYRATEPVPHWHYVTYGYSDIYGENLTDAPDAKSGYGIEMTFRLADDDALNPEAQPHSWPLNMLQNLARYIFSTGNVIYPGHHLDANSPIALDTDTQLTALAFTEDPIGSEISTPSGKVKFVQAVGVTAQELAHLQRWNAAGVLDTIGKRWPRGLTILDRPGLDSDPELVAEIERGIEREGSSTGSYFVETLELERADDDLVITLTHFGASSLAQSVVNRLPHGNPLYVMGAEAMVTIRPQEDTEIRDLSDDGPTATISLTEVGVNALADLPDAPGEYRLAEIPGVVWRLTDPESN